MINRVLGFSILNITLLIMFIVPFLMVTQYTFLSADDYCRFNSSFSSYSENVLDWYLVHNGRFINALWSSLPIYELVVYRCILFFFMFLLGTAIYYFINGLSVFYLIGLTRYEMLFTTLLIYILIICQLPLLYEFFYWLAGASAYLLSLVFLLFFLGILFKSKFQLDQLVTLKLSILLILINGNNEILIPFTILSLLAHLVYSFFKSRRFIVRSVILNFVGILSSLVVILSPGSINRQSYFPEGKQFFLSVINSILSAGFFTIKSLIEWPYCLFYLAFGVFLIKRIKGISGTKCLNPFICLGLSFILLTAVLFVPRYAVGNLSVNSSRIGNMIHFIFLILVLINLFNVTFFLKSKFNNFKIRYFDYELPFIIFLGYILLFNPNYKGVIQDYRDGQLDRFVADFNTRLELIQNSSQSELALKKIEGTNILRIYDITINPDDWQNTCYRSAINSRFSKNFKSLRLKDTD
ncbi:DUF6056 family protein [Leeuwenhoekiella sp. W20_SRS_FM14]|uniref:DUF6056 family protein n=1 Tax=Leeuwenhoekiella sp. W20_SRS_FM14 TaxID=3240270 RepID=UPI003F9E32CD